MLIGWLLLAALISSSPAQGAATGSLVCPSGFRLVAGSCFRRHSSAASWSDAAGTCLRERARLAYPVDAEQCAALKVVSAPKVNGAHWISGRVSPHTSRPDTYVRQMALPPEVQLAAKQAEGRVRCAALDADNGFALRMCHRALRSVCQKASSGGDTCPTGYRSITSGCYQLSKRKLSWDQAAVSCATQGARLALPANPSETRALRKLLGEGQGSFWVSGKTFDDPTDVAEYERQLRVPAHAQSAADKLKGKVMCLGYHFRNDDEHPVGWTVRFTYCGDRRHSLCQTDPTDGGRTCPEHFALRGLLCLRRVNDLQSWDEAAMTCSSFGARLAFPRNAKECNNNHGLLSAFSNRGYWISGKTTDVDSDTAARSYLPQTQPTPIVDGLYARIDTEVRCLEYARQTKWNFRRGWIFRFSPCEAMKHLICQKRRPAAGCPVGFFHSKRRCYLVLTARVNWDMAAVTCTSHGASLARPDDVRECKEIEGMLNPIAKVGYWIAGKTMHPPRRLPKVEPSLQVPKRVRKMIPKTLGRVRCVTYRWKNVGMYRAGWIFALTPCEERKRFVCQIEKQAGRCPRRFHRAGGSCYYAHHQAVTWDMASVWCAKRDGVLAFPKTTVACQQMNRIVDRGYEPGYWVAGKTLESGVKTERYVEQLTVPVPAEKMARGLSGEVRCLRYNWRSLDPGFELTFDRCDKQRCPLCEAEPEADGTCRKRFDRVGRTCVHVVDRPITWDQAAIVCASMAARLSSPESGGELELLTAKVMRNPKYKYWLAGKTVDAAENVAQYTPQLRISPLAAAARRSVRRKVACLTARRRRSGSSALELGFAVCDRKRKYICQTERELGASNCPDGYEQRGVTCLWRSGTARSWDQAALACTIKGGHLALPSTTSDLAYLASAVPPTDTERFWLSGKSLAGVRVREKIALQWKSPAAAERLEPNLKGLTRCLAYEFKSFKDPGRDGYAFQFKECQRKLAFVCQTAPRSGGTRKFWTKWVNSERPKAGRSCELNKKILAKPQEYSVCAKPVAIECRDAGNKLSYASSGLVFRRGRCCSLAASGGIDCRDADQKDGRKCPDMEVRYQCDAGNSDPCLDPSVSCPANSVCKASGSGHRCACTSGFRWDGENCRRFADAEG